MAVCSRKRGQAVLVHCKMGVSRSASTVIAFAMKHLHWSLETALSYVRDCRSIIKPNEGFTKQLQTYNGILNARSDMVFGRMLDGALDSNMCRPSRQKLCGHERINIS